MSFEIRHTKPTKGGININCKFIYSRKKRIDKLIFLAVIQDLMAQAEATMGIICACLLTMGNLLRAATAKVFASSFIRHEKTSRATQRSESVGPDNSDTEALNHSMQSLPQAQSIRTDDQPHQGVDLCEDYIKRHESLRCDCKCLAVSNVDRDRCRPLCMRLLHRVLNFCGQSGGGFFSASIS